MGMHDSSQNFYHTFATLQATNSAILKGYRSSAQKLWAINREKRVFARISRYGRDGDTKIDEYIVLLASNNIP